MRAPGARVFALVTGGGTGGHVYPALALADALVARGHDRSSIHFVGAARGLEAEAVPSAGYGVDLLPLDGLQRSMAPRDLLRSARAAVAFVRALATCFGWLRAWRPRVVVGVGGYASAPCVLAARIARIPTVVHEQNAVPGLVNRVAVRCGARPAVSFPEAPWRDAVVTGNPVRAEIAAVVRAPQGPALLAIVGGSQGAGRLNEAGIGLYDRWRARTDVAIRHVAGPRHVAACCDRLDRIRRPDDRLAYELVGYEHDMPGLYARSAVLLCRSGASTVAEAAVAGVPTVLVPWSGSAEGQQDANARAMVTLGAAERLTDGECDAARVDAVVSALLAEPDRLERMACAARDAGRPDAADRLADLVEEAADARA